MHRGDRMNSRSRVSNLLCYSTVSAPRAPTCRRHSRPHSTTCSMVDAMRNPQQHQNAVGVHAHTNFVTHYACPLSTPPLLSSDGHVLSTYRCRSLGDELSQWGGWLSRLQRGGLTSSRYTAIAADARDMRVPACLATLQTDRRREDESSLDEDGDRTTPNQPEQVQMQWDQRELDDWRECGADMQNAAEQY